MSRSSWGHPLSCPDPRWQSRLVQYLVCPKELGARDGKCENYNDQNMLNEMIDGRPLGSSNWHDARRNDESAKLRRAECSHAFTQNGRYGVPVEEGHTPGSRRVFLVCMPKIVHSLVVGVLPTLHYANGHSFFVQQRFLSTGVWPTAVHVTFCWGDSGSYVFGKLQRMKDFGMWKLPRITFRSSRADTLVAEAGEGEDFQLAQLVRRRYLLVEDLQPLPDSVPFDGADYDQRAFQHVEWQRGVRAQVQHALAMALAMNRTIILPKLWCYCDRYFYRLEKCMIPGGHHATVLPFECPFDHIFDSSRWYDIPAYVGRSRLARRFEQLAFEGRIYGDYLRRTPFVANSRAEVRALTPGGPSAHVNRAGQPSLAIDIPTGSPEAVVARAAAQYEHVAVLRVSLGDAQKIMAGFDTQADADDFHRLVRHLFDIRVAYCQRECRFPDTMYESVKRKERDPCVWLDGKDKLVPLPVIRSAA